MNTKNQCALAITLAMTAISASASSPVNSPYWTTSDGTVIVSANGNPVRTIHYKTQTKTPKKPQPKAFSQMLADMQKTVAKALNAQTPEPTVTAEPEKTEEPIIVLAETPAKVMVPTPAPIPPPAPAPAVAPKPAKLIEPVPMAEKVAEKVVEKIVEKVAEKAIEKAKPLVIPKINYRYNNYKTTVLFDTASAELTSDASSNLKQVYMATKKADKVMSVRLLGHADTRGDAAYNMVLSEQRISTVARLFDRLNLKVTSTLAQGETSPVIGKDGEDLSLSRRVQVFITTSHVD